MPASFFPQLSSWHWAQARSSWPWRMLKIARPASMRGLQPLVVADDGKPARLACDQCREGQELPAFALQLGRPLPLRPADVDAAGEVDGRAPLGLEGRIAGRNTLHALRRLAMAAGAGDVRLARLRPPLSLAVEHPQHAGVVGVPVLHGPGLGAHVLVGGAPLGQGDLAGGGWRDREEDGSGQRGAQHGSSQVTHDAAQAGNCDPSRATAATGFPSPLWGGARGGGNHDLGCSGTPPPCPSPTRGEGTRRLSPRSISSVRFPAASRAPRLPA